MTVVLAEIFAGLGLLNHLQDDNRSAVGKCLQDVPLNHQQGDEPVSALGRQAAQLLNHRQGDPNNCFAEWRKSFFNHLQGDNPGVEQGPAVRGSSQSPKK